MNAFSNAAFVASLDRDQRKRLKEAAAVDAEVEGYLAHLWPFWARKNQLPPPEPWTYWLILAGRGFGKTRTGAETVRNWIRTCDMVNMIGATADDIRDIMVEGESGILAVCPDNERPEYRKSERKLLWPNGAVSLLFSAQEPDRLRGKQHKKIWADEMAAWQYGESWDQAKFGLRLGAHPQAIVTTTPKPVRHIRELMKDSNCVITRGTSYENKDNLASTFFAEIVNRYEGTRLGRQELMAELLEDVPGALWTREMIRHLPISSVPELSRIVIAIDPPASSQEHSNEAGVIAVGQDRDRGAYVLADRSGILPPREWATRAVHLYRELHADCIVVEVNQGGEMCESVIRSVDPNVPIKAVRASRGKYVRAEPVSSIYHRGIVYHCEQFEQLEDQMCSYTSDFDRTENGSPDRLDALVWGLTELFPSLVTPTIKIAQRKMVVR